MPAKYKRLIILSIPVVLAIVLLLVISGSRFRVIGTTPSTKGVVSTSFNGFRLNFNRELDDTINYTANLEDNGGHVKDIVVKDSFMTIRVRPHSENSRYKFTLKNITAKDGSVINEYVFDYVSKYIDLEDLNETERAFIGELSTSYLQDYPIMQFLPYSTLDFKLEAKLEQIEESAETGELYLKATLFLSAADVKIDKKGALQTYRESVSAYIKSIGFNPDEYEIKYEIIEPSVF